jgi:hypothetical protein
MEPAHAAAALAHASASMTKQHDVIGSVVALLEELRFGLGVDAAGIFLGLDGHLELLASSSHRAEELEVHQLHEHEGPCFDAHVGGVPVQASTSDGLAERWPRFGPTMTRAGFHSVHAAPIAAGGTTIGAMGLLRREDAPFSPDESLVAQAFADIASMLIVHLGTSTPEDVDARVQDALWDRIVIEQAKGVLADTHDVSMPEAYDVLVRAATEQDVSLTVWAEQVVRAAQSRG